MKTNAVVRIVIYSLVLLLLLALLCMGLNANMLSFNLGSSGQTLVGTGSVSADDVSKLDIDWAAGYVQIVTADTDRITFSESGYQSDSSRMTYSLKNGTLKLSYSKSTIQIGFASVPVKELTVTVPENWICKELELDGAALDVRVTGLTAGDIDIDGASNTVNYTGTFTSLSCDGADCEIYLDSIGRPEEIDLDGASCQLHLTLPEGCGFLVQMDGLSCDFQSDLDYTSRNGDYFYGDQYCRIDADGLSCDVYIRKGE